MSEPFWETTYADLNATTFGGPGKEFYDIAIRLLPQGQVLDLGCGEGRNALFLAQYGFYVNAVDISQAGIRKLQTQANKLELNIDPEICDIREYVFSGAYDLIISHGCFHFVEKKYWNRLIDQCKSHTKPNGVNVIAVFTDRITPPDDLKEFCVGLFREGELYSLYSDWDILKQESYTKVDEHPGNIRHKHPINKLVARKPSNQRLKKDGQ